MDIHSYIHITCSLQVLGDTTVEFVKSTQWTPNCLDFIPFDYLSGMDLITEEIHFTP
jgi:hypothetical protein